MRKFCEHTYAMTHEGELVMEATACADSILDAKYEKIDIKDYVSKLGHLSQVDKKKLKMLLYDFEDLFDGTLSKWNTNPVDFELKDDA